MRYSIHRRLPKVIGLRIPERPLEPHPPEDGPHLRRTGPTRQRTQSILIPSNSQLPELLEAHQRPLWQSPRAAPLVDPFFRPEEEHGASCVDDVPPPLGSRDREVDYAWLGIGAVLANYSLASTRTLCCVGTPENGGAIR